MNFYKNCLISLILATCLEMPASSRASEVLEQSKLLKAANIHLFIGFEADRVLSFYDTEIQQMQENGNGKLFTLSEQGANAFRFQKRTTITDCGFTDKAMSVKLQKGTPPFVATGVNAASALTWLPAVKSTFDPSAFTDILKIGKIEEAYADFSPLLQGTILTAVVKRKISREEAFIDCLRNPGISYQQETNSLITADACMKDFDRGTFQDAYIRQTIFRELNGKEHLILASEMGADRNPEKAGNSLENFMGVLRIQFNGQQEIWLIWNSPGYEGSGIYAIKQEDLTKGLKDSATWLVYNGC